MSYKTPFFSIITIVYNDVEHIEGTIQSVLTQTYKNYEYIIIDGGSTDGTVDIIKKYQDRITHSVSEPDGGIYPAMNKGINLAKGKALNFMNSADYYKDSDVLQKVADEFLVSEDISFVLGLGSFIDDNGATVTQRGKIVTTSVVASIVERICHQAFFYKKSLHDKFGLYNLKYKICADGLFMYSVYHSEDVKRSLVEAIFAVRRQKGASRSIESIFEHRKMFNEVFGKSIFNDLLSIKYHLKRTSIGNRFYKFLFFIKSKIFRK